jgi:hypothetical protein
MSFSDKYKPTNQKSLFNQPCVNNIKKWIKNLSISECYKKILYLNGPNSCGKKTTINILFKNYNIITIDSDELRRNEHYNNILNNIPSFLCNNLTLFDKNSNKKLGNILFINNISHCEKTILQFINELYINHNIPIILTCNNDTFQKKFETDYNTTFINFYKPSLQDFVILTSNINTSENLSLSNDEIDKIIKSTFFDINQLFYILEHIKYNEKSKDINLDNLKKDHDIDMSEKMDRIFQFNDYNFNTLESWVQADSNIICNNIYQNYLKLFIKETDTKKSQIKDLDLESQIKDLDLIANVCDSLCNYNSQELDTFSDEYNLFNPIISCIKPIYLLHDYKKQTGVTYPNINLTTYRAINYNQNINDFKPLLYNNTIKLYNNAINKNDIFTLLNDNSMLIDIINNLLKKKDKESELYLTDIIWNYNLVEGNDNINKISYKEHELKIELTLFKKYINGFNFKKKVKLLNESNIKNNIKQKILESNHNKKSSFDNLIYNLDDIWTCLKS